MVAVARLIKRTGQWIAWLGSLIAIVWIVAFSSHSAVGVRKFFFLALFVGSVMAIVGMILERFAKQPDVGRQMRQP